jgi:ribosomal protein L12E/L44/L45/RPP1/RPP2
VRDSVELKAVARAVRVSVDRKEVASTAVAAAGVGLEDIREKAKMAAEVDAVPRAPAGIAASEAEQGALVEVDWAAAR